MVVDDSKAMRLIVARTLRQAGFNNLTIVEAENGRVALDAVQNGAGPDLVLSDWNMPEVSGIDFLRGLRAASIEIPFLFVTAEGTKAMKDLAVSEGALGVITKPFTPEVFRQTVGPLLK
jgi:two-component system chemotaxis response regulator CheY